MNQAILDLHLFIAIGRGQPGCSEFEENPLRLRCETDLEHVHFVVTMDHLGPGSQHFLTKR